MVESRKPTADGRTPPPSGRELSARRIERAAAGLAVALLVMRPAFPSEDAAEGSGLAVVGLWGLVAVAWAAAQWARGELRWFGGPADVAAAVLLGAVIVSAFPAAAKRPAVNMASEWGGLIASYWLVRQLFRQPSSRGALVVAMLAAAVTLSAYGVYQAFWGMEPLRQKFAHDQLTVLHELGIAPGSPEEETFRNRLMSHEPFATFALANSLAGFLLAWVPFGIAWLLELAAAPWGGPTDRRDKLGAVLTGLFGSAGFLALLVCLLLTQSRTAWVGFVVQVLGLTWHYVAALLRAHGRRMVAVLCVVAAVAAACFAVTIFVAMRRGKIDEKIFTEATKSLRYRFEYWRATASLIRDHFWLGAGPGNFRGHYLKYKLPESSEEIADPHNMLLEVWATSGVLAAAALIATLGLGAARMMRRDAGSVETADSSETAKALDATRRARGARSVVERAVDWPVVGLAGFLLLAVVFALPEQELYLALLLVWALATGLLGLGVRGRPVSPVVAAWAVVGVAVHLLGAGGIGMPAVAQSLWVLLALGQNVAEANRKPSLAGGENYAFGTTLVVGSAMAAFGLWVLRPVALCQSAIAEGRRKLEQNDLVGAEQSVRSAAEADRLAAEPWLELYRIDAARWAGQRKRRSTDDADEAFGRAVGAAQRAAELAPEDLEPLRQLGALWSSRADLVEASREEQKKEFADRAVLAYERCVEIYPTSAALQARLADALWGANQPERAEAQARRALELDGLTPHADKKLSREDRTRLQRKLRSEKPDQARS